MSRALLIWILFVSAALFAGEAAPLDIATPTQEFRLPIPTAAETAPTRKLLQELFKNEYAKTKTPEDKLALAAKLLEQGQQTNDDPVAKYTCLAEALRLSTEAGALHASDAAIKQLAEFYAVDASALNRKALADILAQSRDGDSQRAIAALKTLETNPGDAAANLTLGRVLCFHREMWETGLPYLSNSSDEKLKAVAAEELSKPADALAISAMADAWWDIGAKESEPRKGAILRHAGEWYREALPELSGLSKAKVEKRLNEIPTAKTAAGSGIVRAGRKINLLTLVDPARDTVNGSWRMQEKKLVCESGFLTRLQFPYKPPEEYDLRLVFTRTAGKGVTTNLIPAGGKAVMWGVSSWSDQFHAFDYCDGKEGNANDTRVNATAETRTVNGKQSESIVRVRKSYIECLVNGKVVQKWEKIDRLQCNSGWMLKKPELVGIGAHNSQVEFTVVELTEISGPGTPSANTTTTTKSK